jgi:hypothetical protein
MGILLQSRNTVIIPAPEAYLKQVRVFTSNNKEIWKGVDNERIFETNLRDNQ